MKRSVITLTFIAALVFIVFSAFKPQTEGQKKGAAWDIPEKYQTMENPYADDESLVSIGKMHYMKHCRSCHGNKGLGDGPKARNLETWPGDFSTDEFKETKDGALYYMSIIGRDEMPNYEGKLPDDEDRWALIMYIKTL